jgi:hypothetical protein
MPRLPILETGLESADVAVEDEPPTDILYYKLGPRVSVRHRIGHSSLSERIDSQRKEVEPPSVVRQKMIDNEHTHDIPWPDNHFTPQKQSNGVWVLVELLYERQHNRSTISAVKKRNNSPARVSKGTSQPYDTIAGCGASSHLSDEELASFVVRQSKTADRS